MQSRRIAIGLLVLLPRTIADRIIIDPYGLKGSSSFFRSEVVRIQAVGCAGSSARVGTGFVWHSSTEIVSALHVVAGCRSAAAFSERDHTLYPLTLRKVLHEADLVLLTAGDGAAFPSLTERVARTQMDDVLTGWGYGEGIPSMRSFHLRVANGGATLRENIPGDVARAIQRAGSPALTVKVVPIDDPIAAGLSGAPLLDAGGDVRAIADGGVGHGLSHVSWAIPASYLQDLLNSSESLTTYGTASADLSAAEGERAEVYNRDFTPRSNKTLSCGAVDLVFDATRPFSDVAPGTDSPGGLQQLLALFGPAAPPFSLDIYKEAESGAAVAFPAGAVVTSNAGYCHTSLLGGQIEMTVHVEKTDMAHLPGVATQFEQSSAPPPTFLWQPDPAWTYPFPFTRPDGLVVRRLAFARSYPANPFGAPTDYAFETLAFRNGLFVGVMAVRRNDLALFMCMRGIQGAVCPPATYIPTWAQAALAVHLTTFGLPAAYGGNGSWQGN